MVSAFLFLVLAIAWPHAADSLLRALLVTLAAGLVVVRGYYVVRVRATHDVYSPFDAGPSESQTGGPDALRKLTSDLGALDEGAAARTRPIPWSVCSVLIDETARRLNEHHGLRMGDPAHHPAIQALLSESAWLLVAPRGREPGSGDASRGRGRLVPLADLDLILDDVEAL
jgi:hypothetical protein